MHNLAEAIGEGVERKVLYQRIVHTAVITTGAMSACIYEKLPNGRLKGVAVEGLFPPQRAIKLNLNEKDSPRARFIEKVLNSEVLEAEEGIVGQVSKTGKPVLFLTPQKTLESSNIRIHLFQCVRSFFLHLFMMTKHWEF